MPKKTKSPPVFHMNDKSHDHSYLHDIVDAGINGTIGTALLYGAEFAFPEAGVGIQAARLLRYTGLLGDAAGAGVVVSGYGTEAGLATKWAVQGQLRAPVTHPLGRFARAGVGLFPDKPINPGGGPLYPGMPQPMGPAPKPRAPRTPAKSGGGLPMYDPPKRARIDYGHDTDKRVRFDTTQNNRSRRSKRKHLGTTMAKRARYSKRRPSRRRRSYRRTARPIARSLQGHKSMFPRTKKFSHSQAALGYIQPSAGQAPAGYTVKANSINKPLASFPLATTACPLYTDQLGAQYDKCLVVKATIRADFHPKHGLKYNSIAHDGTAGEGPQNCIVGLYVGDESSVSTSPHYYQSRPGTVFSMCPVGGTKTLVTSVVPHQWLGTTNPMADDTLQTSETGDPTRKLFFHVWAQTGSYNDLAWTGTDQEFIDAHVSVTYDVVWFDPKSDITASTN